MAFSPNIYVTSYDDLISLKVKQILLTDVLWGFQNIFLYLSVSRKTIAIIKNQNLYGIFMYTDFNNYFASLKKIELFLVHVFS